MRINNAEYHVWVTIEKDCEKPGGNSLSEYCTSVAGLLRCCNNVIFLFVLKQQFLLVLQSNRLQVYFQNGILPLE